MLKCNHLWHLGASQEEKSLTVHVTYGLGEMHEYLFLKQMRKLPKLEVQKHISLDVSPLIFNISRVIQNPYINTNIFAITASEHLNYITLCPFMDKNYELYLKDCGPKLT